MAKHTARKTRIVLVAGVAGSVFSLGVAGTALATNATDAKPTHTSAHKTAGTSASAQTHQAQGVKFYKEYVSAWKDGDLKKAEHLRDTRLTKHCAKEVKAWGEKHNGDGVLRARSLPKSVDGVDIVQWPGIQWPGRSGFTSEIHLKYKKKEKNHRVALKFDNQSKKIARIAPSPRYQTWPPKSSPWKDWGNRP